MPSLTFTDVARARVDAISFFVVLGLLSAWGIQGIWNSFRVEFPRLPRLTYFKAVGLTILWGLLFLIVLTMISGARELMTPGAWVKQGYTYRLAEDNQKPPAPDDAAKLQDDRKDRLQKLARTLLAYAAQHQGKFPPRKSDLPAELWHSADPSHIEYVYVTNLTAQDGGKVLVYEPAVFGEKRFVLLANGEIKEEFWQQSPPETKPAK